VLPSELWLEQTSRWPTLAIAPGRLSPMAITIQFLSMFAKNCYMVLLVNHDGRYDSNRCPLAWASPAPLAKTKARVRQPSKVPAAGARGI